MAMQRMKVAGNDCTLPYKQIYLIFGGIVKEMISESWHDTSFLS